MKLYIAQHYSRNKGNVSLLYTLVESIRQHIPDCEITIASFDPKNTQRLFGYRCCEWPFQSRRLVDARGWLRLWRALGEACHIVIQVILAVLIRWHWLSPARMRGRYVALREIAEANLVISPGGHLFTTFNPFPGVFAHFYPCLLSSIMRIRYLVIGQTIGPFFGVWKIPARRLTRYVLEHAAYVSVRDSNSLETIATCGFHISRLAQTSELVFLFPQHSDKKSESKIRPPNGKKTVGFTFHHIYYQRWMSHEDYVDRMVRFIRLIATRFDMNIVFIAMEDSSTGRGDVPLLKEIIAKLVDSVTVRIADTPMDPRLLLPFFAGLDFLVATKTHSIVYGLRYGIPTLAISYDRKTDDFMREFNQETFSIPLASFDPDEAFSCFVRLVEQSSEINRQLQDRLTAVQNKSLENILSIRRFLAETS